MTPEQAYAAETGRAGAALILAVAEERHDDVAVILGCDPAHDRLAGIADRLARWLSMVLRAAGEDPAEWTRTVIDSANEREARP